MRQTVQTIIPNLIDQHYQRLVDGWLACQKREGATGQITEAQLAEQSRRFLVEVRKGVAIGHFDDLSGPEWDSTRDLLDNVAAERAVRGFSSTETAVFVFSLKEPLFELLREEITEVEVLARETWVASLLIDNSIPSRAIRRAENRSSGGSKRSCSNFRRQSSNYGTRSSRCR